MLYRKDVFEVFVFILEYEKKKSFIHRTLRRRVILLLTIICDSGQTLNNINMFF